MRRRPRRTEPKDERTAFEDLVDREWARLAAPGAWLTGAERVAVASAARAAMRPDLADPAAPPGPPVLVEAAVRVATGAATIRADDVARWEAAGLGPLPYVETVGIVSRLSAIDVAAFGLGREPRPLPVPRDGEPTRALADDAVIDGGWVPTVGRASAPSSLSAVPAEVDAMFDVAGVLYLTLVEMGDLTRVRDDLHRTQMELTAARTSWLNDCFY